MEGYLSRNEAMSAFFFSVYSLAMCLLITAGFLDSYGVEFLELGNAYLALLDELRKAAFLGYYLPSLELF